MTAALSVSIKMAAQSWFEVPVDYQVIREARLRSPFRPFALRFRNGEEFFVDVPWHLAIADKVLGVVNQATGGTATRSPQDVIDLIYADEMVES